LSHAHRRHRVEHVPRPTSSIESAITSRLTSESHASVPIVMRPKCDGVELHRVGARARMPASKAPHFRRPKLHGMFSPDIRHSDERLVDVALVSLSREKGTSRGTVAPLVQRALISSRGTPNIS